MTADDVPTGSAPAPGSSRPALPTPWPVPMQRADKVILAGLTVSTIVGLVMLPLTPLLVSSHPALLEALRGSTTAIVNMGARAKIGETSFLLAVFLGIPSLMAFDWVFWWAGKRWGDRVFLWLLGGDDARSRRRLERMQRYTRRFGPYAVLLAYFIPVPSALVYAAVGESGMRFRTFFVLDLIGTLLWTTLFACLGYSIGQGAVDVADAIGRYSLYITIGLIVGIVAWQARSSRRP